MKNTITYTLVLLGTLILSSCNDWLDVKPKVEVEETKLFEKAQGFKDALTACYIKLDSTSLYGKNMTMSVVEHLAQHWDLSVGVERDEDKLKDFRYDSEYAEGCFKSIYGEMYNTIVQANTVLANLETNGDIIAEESLRQLIEAEALGIRAFCHTDILRLFGQMPLKPTIQVQLPYARTVTNEKIPYYSYSDFTDLILQDIKKAQDLFKTCDPVMTYTYEELDNYKSKNSEVELKDEFMGFRRFRFNYYAMEALKARLYMYMGNHEQARIAARQVIDAKSKSGAKMLTLAGDNDLKNNYFALPSECILALSNSNIENDIKNLYGYDHYFLTTGHFNDLFAGQSTGVNNRALNQWQKRSSSSGNEYQNFQKYLQPAGDKVSDANLKMTKHQIIPLLRLSEMYLIAIETAPLQEANTLYKEYMEARNVSVTALTQEEMTAEILNEYRREFWGEGQMFYTYKRLGMTKMLWKSDREITEKDYIVPLPASELDSN